MKKAAETIKQYILVTLGCFLYAFGFFAFVHSAQITTGGVTGIVNIVNMIVPIHVGLVILAINIPLLVVCLIVYKWRFTVRTIFGTVVSSLFITLCENTMTDIFPLTDNILICGLVGGILTGAGLGIIMRNRASTGGTDIVIKLLHRKWKHISGGKLHIIIDGMILTFFFIVTKNFETTIYALITMVVSNGVFDLVLYGLSNSKTVYIITDKTDEIAELLLTKCNCGATILQAQGAYSHQDKRIILCVVKNSIFPQIKELVHKVDPSAFMIVGKSAEIYGEGFSGYEDILM